MSIPVLFLKYRLGEEDNLDQRMDNEYIDVFAPEIARLERAYRHNTAWIVPVGDLLEDQIALLKSRGAKSLDAEITKVKYQPFMAGSLKPRAIDEAKMFNDLCVFQRLREQGHTWLLCYTIHHTFGLSSDTFRFRFGFSSYGGFSAPPSLYS